MTREDQLRTLLARVTLKSGENHPLAVKIRQRLAEEQLGMEIDDNTGVRKILSHGKASSALMPIRPLQ